MSGVGLMQRVIVYIDGFNLYYGLKEMRWQRYYWLDVCKLANKLLRRHQKLMAVHYFTTRIALNPNDPAKKKRQDIFIEALETLPDLTTHFGKFLSKERRCKHCGKKQQIYEEKMTDVNIAVQLLNDAQDNQLDTAIVVSADSDLVGPICAVLRRFPKKRVIAAFPPKRFSKALRDSATGYLRVTESNLKNSQLPPQIVKPNGHILNRPTNWK